MIIPVKTSSGGYDILLERGALFKAGQHFALNRKVLIVTDSGVPAHYAKTVADQCESPITITIPMGEESKSADMFLEILRQMTVYEFTRSDCVVAVGGGVVGDLSGFAAACYMRGIDFYNIPTTLLSQVDSSIGGKTAIDYAGYKNIVGAFWQPKAVLIDPDVLRTLPDRQISNGMAEAVKMALTSDSELFEIFERGQQLEKIETVIERSLKVKRYVVEQDERESGLRKILNFGHTLAHAIESANSMKTLYHGECVALGMLPMCSDDVRARLMPVLKKLNLPTEFEAKPSVLIEAMRHDKKASGNEITVIFVPTIGEFEMKKMPLNELSELIERVGKE